MDPRPALSPADPRWFGLDALRALAIAMVVVYHLNLAGILNGGFLGVDLFFVISGFLITSLLLTEYEQNGRLALAAFFVRRFHRLVPPFAVMVIVCTWLTPYLAPDAYARLIDDLPFTFYLSNWWQIYAQQSYFEGFHNPRIFQHLWSLAIEEQYYLLWPLLLMGLLQRGSRKLAGVVCLGLAWASTAWMAYYFVVHIQGGDPSRVYFGTDTHVMGLFIGAGLACFWNPKAQGFVSWWICRHASLRVALGLWICSALLWMAWNWHDQNPLVYCGGFALWSLCSAALIVLVVDPAPVVAFKSALLGYPRAGVVWVGTRSYSIYLWHWPVFIWIDPQGASALQVALARLLVTALVAECSYRFIELQWKNARAPGSRKRRSLALTLAFVLSAGYALVRFVPAPEVPPVAVLDGRQDNTEPALTEAGQEAKAAPGSAEESSMRFDTHGQRTLVLGDSVMLGARGALVRAFPNMYVDAEVGRQASQGLNVLQQFFASHKTPEFVVIHLGTNGYIYEKHFRQILEFVRPCQRVIVVNNYADRRWTAQNNELIQRVLADFDNVRLVDWHVIGQESRDYFVADGVHLTSKGMRRFVNALGETLRLDGVPMAEVKKSKPTAAPAASPASVAAGAREPSVAACAAGNQATPPSACANHAAPALPPASATPAIDRE